MKSRGGKDPAGFTIVEVLLVLAISGIILLGAVFFVQGQTGNSEFTNAVNQTQTQLQGIINDVGNGSYPSGGSFTCTPGTAGSPPTFSSAASGQGSNLGCVFLGKVVQFDSNKNFYVYSIAGNQCTTPPTATTPCTVSQSLAQVSPVAIDDSGHNADLTNRAALDNGLQLLWIKYRIGTSVAGRTSLIAFITNLPQTSGGGSVSITSGSLGVNQLYVIGNSALAINTEANALTPISTVSSWIPVDSVDICLVSGTNSKSAVVSISSRSSISLTIYQDMTCS